MKKILAIFVICFLVVLPLRLSFAEEQEQHFCIQLEPTYMDVQGIDEHVGDIVKYKVRTLYDVTENLSIGPTSIGATTFLSICYNGPVAPTSHATDWDPEDFWRLEKGAFKFLGVGLALNLRF